MQLWGSESVMILLTRDLDSSNLLKGMRIREMKLCISNQVCFSLKRRPNIWNKDKVGETKIKSTITERKKNYFDV